MRDDDDDDDDDSNLCYILWYILKSRETLVDMCGVVWCGVVWCGS